MRSISYAAALAAAFITGALAQQQHAFSLPTTTEPISFASSSHHQANFSGHQVVRFNTATHQQHHVLLSQAHKLGLDVWAARHGDACQGDADEPLFGCIDIHLAAGTHDEDPLRPSASCSEESCSIDAMAHLMQPFTEQPPKSAVLIDDLEAVILSQKRLFTSSQDELQRQAQLIKSNAWHKEYHTFQEISAYLRMLEAAYPGHARVVELGTTHEGRPILGLKISKDLAPPPSPPTDPNPDPDPQPDPPSNATSSSTSARPKKLGIVITGGQHAREWISTSSSLFFASELLRTVLGEPVASPNATHPSFAQAEHEPNTLGRRKKGRKGRKGRKKKSAQPWSKKQAEHLLSTFEITVVPVSNPDGYVYSWDHNRMWRKNRQPNRFPGGLFCKGLDVNRNYGFAFSSGYASSACSEMYAGSSAFSAAESRAIAGYLEDEENNVHGYFDLHSYGQLMMYPFSYSCQQPVADEEDLLEVALGAVSALKQMHARQYNAGKICQVYAQAGGNSLDWSYASTQKSNPHGASKKKIKWSLAIELRDGGTYGFLLPKEQIIPASEEVAAALAYMLSFVAKKDAH